MCSGSEAGSYLRLIDFVYHSTLGLRVMVDVRRHAEQGVAIGQGVCSYRCTSLIINSPPPLGPP